MNLRKQLSSYIALNNYVEAFRSGQLPTGYTELEYIESTGTQYIDTGIANWNNTLEYEIKLSIEPQTGIKTYFGCYNKWSTSENNVPNISTWTNYKVASNFRAGYTSSSGIDIGISNGQTGTISLKGNTISWSEGSSTSFDRGYDFTVPISIFLFAQHARSNATEFATTKIYRTKFWLNGELIRDFRPALDYNNVVGMYDTVTRQFFTNSGTGSFVAGPEVYKSSSSIVLTDAITNGLTDLQLKGGTEQRNLPAEYTQLEYITFPSGAYIKTGIVPKTFDYEVGFKGAFGILPGGPNCAWGFMGDGLIPRWICATYSSYYLLNANTTRTFGNADTNTHTFVGRVYEKNGIYCWSSEFDGVIQQNDQTLDNTANWEANTLEMYVGARNNNSTAGNYGLITANHWWCKKAGVMIADYIPAKRNSDNVLGMYDTVSGTFFTNQGTGTFTAGPDAVPTPNTPMDIVSNNGVLKVSPNLFDKNASYALFNGYINNESVGENTTLMAYSGGDKTIIIKVAPNTTYTVTRVTNLGSVYDRIRCAAFATLPSGGSAGVILCNYMNKTQANATFTTLSDTQYVAINVRNSGAVGDDWTQFVDAFQLEKGSTATQYRPYGQIYTDGTPETVTITGKNLLDINKTSGAGYLSTSGELVPYNDYYCSDYIEVKPSTVYTYTETMKSAVNGNYIKFCFYDSNKTFIPPRQGDTPTAEAKTYTYKITSPVNAKYIRISSHSNFVKGQLEESIRPTKYEEYYQASFALEDLLKLSDYQDVQSVLDGVVTRNVGIKVLDGTENWTRYGTGRFATPLIGSKKQDNQQAPISTHFIGTSDNNVPVKDGYMSVFNGSIAPTSGTLGINYQATPEVAEFKQWLADQYANGTPVIVVYPLANTVEETVESRDVFITSGTNTIERNSEYVASDGITVKYKKLR